MLGWIRNKVETLGAWWSLVVRDIDGFPSSKRLGLIAGTVMLAGSWAANIFGHILTDPHIIDALLGLTGVTGVGIAGERFGKLLPSAKPSDKDNNLTND